MMRLLNITEIMREEIIMTGNNIDSKIDRVEGRSVP